jgi:hypothetical protein
VNEWEFVQHGEERDPQMIQEGHITPFPAPLCGSRRWAVLRMVAPAKYHWQARLHDATLSCDLHGERRVINLGMDYCSLTRSHRGEVVSQLHTSERHKLTLMLEGLLRGHGHDVQRRPIIQGALYDLPIYKPSKSGLEPWEVLERLDAWALGVEGLRVESVIWGEEARTLKLGARVVKIIRPDRRWRVWEQEEEVAQVEPAQLLDRVIELVRSMRR